MEQVELWNEDRTGIPEGVAPRPEDLRAAGLLLDSVRLGTSSWSFPGWRGIVYARRVSKARLAREGLRAYAGHPLLRLAGIDWTYYRPPETGDLEPYTRQVPEGFRFLVKAPGRVHAGALSGAAPLWGTGGAGQSAVSRS